MLLAMIRAIEKEGISEREIGKIVYYFLDRTSNPNPSL